jgi:thiamine-phosphate pyrophosphorylase
VIPGGLYGIVDPTFGDPRRQVALLAEEGVGILQLRCKGWPSPALVELARWSARQGPVVVVNDDVSAAAEAGCMVHLGQQDGTTALAFGRSTHDLAQVRAAAPADYVGFGPVFATRTKAGELRARGPRWLGRAVAASCRPVVAIGGITPENLDRVRATGAHGWAAIAAIWTARDPRVVVREMLR